MVNNSTYINKTKESLNSDGQQFYLYQQNEQSPLTSNYCSQKRPMTYGIGNPNSGLVQASKCGRVKPVNGFKFAIQIGQWFQFSG
jgi:hypothetical protein